MNQEVTYIDLGLSVKWADRNVGTNLPRDFGEYYTDIDLPEGNLPTKEQWEELQSLCTFITTMLEMVSLRQVLTATVYSYRMQQKKEATQKKAFPTHCSGHRLHITTNSKTNTPGTLDFQNLNTARKSKWECISLIKGSTISPLERLKNNQTEYEQSNSLCKKSHCGCQ